MTALLLLASPWAVSEWTGSTWDFGEADWASCSVSVDSEFGRLST